MTDQLEAPTQLPAQDDPEVVATLRRLLSAGGRITFADFMNCVLYSTRGGYYATGRAGGRDYRTSPDVHPLFAALLCLQLEQMWTILGRPQRFDVVEVGAGGGELCRGILGYAPYLAAGFAGSLRYVMVEPFADARLGNRPNGAHRLRASALAMPLQDVVGCVISNELIDAFPVHRITMRNGVLQELFVAGTDDDLEEVLAEPSSPQLAGYFRKLDIVLHEGALVEVNLAGPHFIREVERTLQRGFALTIDYGKAAEDLYLSERQSGTLRCFRQHRCVSDPYSHLGHQDITADVDFSSLILAGSEVGLRLAGSTTQRDFLFNLGFEFFADQLAGEAVESGRRYENKFAMQELVSRSGLGAFRVLVQHKGVSDPQLDGLHLHGQARRQLFSGSRRLPLPLI